MAQKPKKDTEQTRQLKRSKRRWLVGPRKSPKDGPKLANVLTLSFQSIWILAKNWKVFGGLTFWYGFLVLLLVQGFAVSNNFGPTKDTLDQAAHGSWDQLLAGLGLFANLLNAGGNPAGTATGSMQMTIVLVFSLALIWALRQAYAGHQQKIRDSLYKGSTPLVPFVLVGLVIMLELLPMAIGVLIYTTIVSNGLAASAIEQFLWAFGSFMLVVLTLYLLVTSLLSLYIVTLPEMTPIKALRAAKQLVSGRRWIVLRKIIYLPAALIVLAALLTMPFIFLVPAAAPWAVFAVSILFLPIAHSYMYTLYRSLL